MITAIVSSVTYPSSVKCFNCCNASDNLDTSGLVALFVHFLVSSSELEAVSSILILHHLWVRARHGPCMQVFGFHTLGIVELVGGSRRGCLSGHVSRRVKRDIPDGSLSLISIITSVISTIISSTVRIVISPVAPVHQQSTFARWLSLTSPCPYHRTYPYRRRTVACHLCPFRTHRHHLESRVHHLFHQRRHLTTRTNLQPGLLSPLY